MSGFLPNLSTSAQQIPELPDIKAKQDSMMIMVQLRHCKTQLDLLHFSQLASQHKDAAVRRMLTLLILFVALDRSADVSLSEAL